MGPAKRRRALASSQLLFYFLQAEKVPTPPGANELTGAGWRGWSDSPHALYGDAQPGRGRVGPYPTGVTGEGPLWLGDSGESRAACLLARAAALIYHPWPRARRCSDRDGDAVPALGATLGTGSMQRAGCWEEEPVAWPVVEAGDFVSRCHAGLGPTLTDLPACLCRFRA